VIDDEGGRPALRTGRASTRRSRPGFRRGRLEEPEPTLDRQEFTDMLAPLGPLVGLGMGDVATTRSVLRKVGLSKIVIKPDGLDGWKFTGPANLIGLAVHKRTQAAPPDTPTGYPSRTRPG